MRLRSNIIWILVSLITLISCNGGSQPLYGKDFNDQRSRAGAPTIPDDWEVVSFSSNYTQWYNPRLEEYIKSHTPFHASKYVEYERGTLNFEQDIYYGFEDVHSRDGTFRESISITVYYGGIIDNFDIMELIWEILLSDENGFMEDISLEDAKRILGVWKIYYP